MRRILVGTIITAVLGVGCLVAILWALDPECWKATGWTPGRKVRHPKDWVL